MKTKRFFATAALVTSASILFSSSLFSQNRIAGEGLKINTNNDTLYSETFGNGLPAGWTQSGTNQFWKAASPNYVIQGCYSNGSARLKSSTAANGTMIFDGDSANKYINDPACSSGGGSYKAFQGSLISNSINLTGYDSIHLSFQQRFRLCCNTITTTITASVSGDGGITWTDFDARHNVALNQSPITNPDSMDFNISSVAGNKSDVRIKFTFTSESGVYFWEIDDISIYLTYPSVSTGWIKKNCSNCTKACYIDGGTIAPAGALQISNTSTDTSNYGYVYWTFNATADTTYYFDLCASSGTSGLSWLRLHNDRNISPNNNYCMDVNSTPTLILQNFKNGCSGTGTGLSKLIWTCQESGAYYLETASGSNKTYWGAQGSQAVKLSYKTLPSFSNVCSDVFYDKGTDGSNGSSAAYNNNENWVYTYYPTDTVTELINVQFTSFSTSPGDILCVYNGNSIYEPILGCYSGPSITGAFTSSANDGSLTFQFTSDDSLVLQGWRANVSCISALGIHDNTFVNKISIYPDPVTSSFTLRLNSHLKDAEVIIFDMLGHEMMRKRMNGDRMEIERGNLESGIYFVKVVREEQEWVEKIVVE